jgi:hypothetical protein
MLRVSLVLGVVAAVGCAGELDNPARFTNCPPGAVEQTFQAHCQSADGKGCHGSNAPDADLDLVSPGVGARVRGLTSKSLCEGRALVEEPGGSHLLVEKLDEPSCGARMPLGQPSLSPNEIECVRRWVDNLAETP